MTAVELRPPCAAPGRRPSDEIPAGKRVKIF